MNRWDQLSDQTPRFLQKEKINGVEFSVGWDHTNGDFSIVFPKNDPNMQELRISSNEKAAIEIARLATEFAKDKFTGDQIYRKLSLRLDNIRETYPKEDSTPISLNVPPKREKQRFSEKVTINGFELSADWDDEMQMYVISLPQINYNDSEAREKKIYGNGIYYASTEITAETVFKFILGVLGKTKKGESIYKVYQDIEAAIKDETFE